MKITNEDLKEMHVEPGRHIGVKWPGLVAKRNTRIAPVRANNLVHMIETLKIAQKTLCNPYLIEVGTKQEGLIRKKTVSTLVAEMQLTDEQTKLYIEHPEWLVTLPLEKGEQKET